jgi:hypothetical protein
VPCLSLPSILDTGDLEHRQLLTVALALVITGLVLELVDTDLGTLGVLENLAGDSDLLQRLGVGGHLGAVDDQSDGQRHGAAWRDVELLHLDDVTGSDLVLLATGLDDRVRGRFGCHRWSSSASRAGAHYPRVCVRVLGCGGLRSDLEASHCLRPA